MGSLTKSCAGQRCAAQTSPHTQLRPPTPPKPSRLSSTPRYPGDTSLNPRRSIRGFYAVLRCATASTVARSLADSSTIGIGDRTSTVDCVRSHSACRRSAARVSRRSQILNAAPTATLTATTTPRRIISSLPFNDAALPRLLYPTKVGAQHGFTSSKQSRREAQHGVLETDPASPSSPGGTGHTRTLGRSSHDA